jgi:hypothetical protein
MLSQIQSEHRDLIRKDAEIGRMIAACKEERFKLEQRTNEFKLAEAALTKAKTMEAIPWHLKICALIGLYGKTLVVFFGIAVLFFSTGYMAGNSLPWMTVKHFIEKTEASFQK